MTEERKPNQTVLDAISDGSDGPARCHRELEALVQHSPDAILRFDSQKQYVFVNRMAERYTGLPGERLIGRRIGEQPIPGEAEGNWSRALDAVFESAAPTSFEYTSHTPRGERFFEVRLQPELSVDGDFDTVLAVTRDITKQRHHERRLEESEERWRRLMDCNPDAVVVYAEDRLVYGNEAAAQLFRVSNLEDLVGRSVYDFFSAEDYAVIQGRLGKLYGGVRLEPHQYRLIRADGDECDVQVYSVPIKYAGKNAVQSVMHDVTDQREYERHLIEARLRAEEIARLKSSIIMNLSHEIRTPLANVLGFNEVLRDHVDLEGMEMLDVIAVDVERLMTTLSTVLEIARIEGGEVVPVVRDVDVAELVIRAIQEVRPQARRKNIEIRLDAEPVKARIDPVLTSQIVRHLVDNAVKFTDEGHVWIRIQCEEEVVSIDVEDTGIGIAADFMPRLFDEFEQESKGMSRDYEGIGLGLSIVKRLAQTCGAQISVESRSGAGSTFSVCFPLAASVTA